MPYTKTILFTDSGQKLESTIEKRQESYTTSCPCYIRYKFNFCFCHGQEKNIRNDSELWINLKNTDENKYEYHLLSDKPHNAYTPAALASGYPGPPAFPSAEPSMAGPTNNINSQSGIPVENRGKNH